MTSFPQILAAPTRPAARLDGLRRHLARILAAHDHLARLGREVEEASRDAGLPPETLLGAPVHDATLPFFFRRPAGRD